jgi:hypothetical protein
MSRSLLIAAEVVKRSVTPRRLWKSNFIGRRDHGSFG